VDRDIVNDRGSINDCGDAMRLAGSQIQLHNYSDLTDLRQDPPSSITMQRASPSRMPVSEKH
jgi:hypothetical protein